MPVSAALALTAHLNACRHSPLSPEVAARAVIGEHAAHHVVDPEGLLGLDPLTANELDRAMAAALMLVDSDWAVALPRPGRLAPLAGPPTLTAAALDAGAAVLPVVGGPAWVPRAVGPAIQWQILSSAAPQLTLTAADADRQLREVVVQVGRRLADLPLGTSEEDDAPPPILPAGYGSRSRQLLARAWRLSRAAGTALEDDGNTLHVHAIGARRSALGDLRDAADSALAAAVTWTGASA